MKKLLLFMLIVVGIVSAQNYDVSVQSTDNSSTALIDSAGTFTGTWELMRGFNSISLTIYADSSSSTDGVQVQFSANKSEIDYYFKTSYTAGDTTFNKSIPVLGMWMRVLFTTDAVDTVETVRIVTTLHQGNRPNINTDGDWIVEDPTLKNGEAKAAILDNAGNGIDSDNPLANLEVNTTQDTCVNTTLTTSTDSIAVSFTAKFASFFAECGVTDSVFISTNSSFTAATTRTLTYFNKFYTSMRDPNKWYLKSNGSVGVSVVIEGR